ncbi:MAG TPA: DUF6049 family protein [Pyrinomonadaceae bacterium]|nr:DUF6049 family protein [Pyrinomonadaceae bacterium]
MKQLTSLILIFAVYTSLISPVILRAQIVRGGNSRTNMNQSAEKGLKFRLSEGAAGAENRRATEPAKGDALSETETSNLLKRLPAVKIEQNDQTDFAKRQGTLPAPKTGKVVNVKFPAAEQRTTPNPNLSNTLEVIRFSPAGEVLLAPDLNITFSQPMIAVTAQEEAANNVPVQLLPQPEGKWRWLGTKTLMFDAARRFPMATRFSARVPAGTKSATGQVLPKDVVWAFQTPPPTLETKIPENQTTGRDVLMFVSFDQEINREVVIKTISITAGGRKIPVRPATADEIAKDESISYYVKNVQPNRWIAFRAVNADGSTENALPADAQITVTIEKGTPSAEGELTTIKAQSFSFKTFGAMKFVKNYCGWNENKKPCAPSDGWRLGFTNQIDDAHFDKSWVKIEPNIPGLKIYPQGNSIVIDGAKPPRKSFKVTVDGALRDAFGQTLGQSVSAVFNVGAAENSFNGAGGNLVVLDPFAAPVFSIYSTNYAAAKVKIYRVEPNDWNQLARYLKFINYDEGKRPAMPGKLVSDTVLKIKNTPDEFVETPVDLRGFLNDGLGNLILDIEAVEDSSKAVTVRGSASRKVVWIQSTRIGLDAFVDNRELVGFATDLRTGKPLSGVGLTIAPNGEAVGGQRSVVSEDEEKQVAETNQTWSKWFLSWFIAPPENLKGAGVGSESDAIALLETISRTQTKLTAANGVARLALPESQAKEQSVLIARRGNDVAFLPKNTEYYYQETGSWFKKPDGDSLRWFVFDDRKMYRPDEEVSIKGYIRKITGGKFGDVEPLGDAAGSLSYSVKDSRDNEIGKGAANLNAFGAFDFKFVLPDNANLGYSRIEFTTASGLENSNYSHRFQIQEFRRPEFEVKAQNETPAPYFVKSSATVSVNANYFAGGGLANAETNWNITATPTNYTPPNREDFTFGKWFAWWRDSGGDDDETTNEEFKGVTDASGKHLLKIDFEAANPARPFAVSANASVQDVNRQTWASSTTLLVHPSELYVGIRTAKTFVQPNEAFDVETIVSDIDGKLIVNRNVEIKAVLRDWTFDKGEWQETVVEEQACNVQSGETARKCRFTPNRGGNYTIAARVLDDRERPNESELTVWVAGAKTEPKRDVEQEEAQLIPNKKDYAPGDVAEILVQSPFENAEGVLTLRRDGIVKTERFTMKGSSTVLRIPLEEKYLPNIHAQVDLVGAAARETGSAGRMPALRPAFASGEINLPVSTRTRSLTVSAEPQAKSIEPGGATKIDVAVKDNQGNAVAASEVALVVVDESILALTDYKMPNPLDVFYTEREANVMDYHSRENILLGNPDDVISSDKSIVEKNFELMQVESLPMRVLGGESANMQYLPANGARNTSPTVGKSQIPIELRTNFNALAVFAPSVKTDANGKAIVDIKLPDNLTRYRVMAVVVDDSGKRFGKGESNLTAKQPLMVRPSAPRFMNFGDKIELPVVVHNQTDSEMTVDVAVRATNAELTNGGGRKVTIPANDRAEVRFPVAASKAGTARFQFAATSGKFADAAEIELPVWTPATSEAFATYGTTDENGAIFQPVEAPKDVFEQFGGLEITTSSTQLQELTDAFIYLQNYPFECSEQVASRMISVAALQDVLRAFKAKEMPTDAELKARFARDIEILKSLRRADGSFGLWKRDGERYNFPFVSAHVAHALVLAKAKGYDVPDEMLKRTKTYLKNIETHFDQYHKSPEVRRAISAYALYVRDLMNDKDSPKAKKILAEATIEKMPFEALGWILSVLANDKNSQAEVENIKRFLMNRTTETAATANFVTDYGDASWLIMYSNRRADGVLLEALLKTEGGNPSASAGAVNADTVQKSGTLADARISAAVDASDLIPKLVRGLLDRRTKGRWNNTQENVFILLALDKYFNAFEKAAPDFVTRVWLGNAFAGEQIFKGRSVDSNLLNIPMNYLLEQNGAANLILDKQGAGRLYYRIGLNYAPKNLNLKAADNGFTVLRSYEAIDDAEDVKQNPDNSWTIKSGARVRVRLTMVAPARRYHVALVDPLPAGLEILNPELATTEAIPPDAGNPNQPIVPPRGKIAYGNYWRYSWFEHRNFRDERAEAFSSMLWEGVYNYSYVARATTPGQFVVPPAKAEEMYHPETFGRTKTDFVEVE